MPLLYEYQKRAVDNLKSGSILCGGVGSGKSRTALAYYISKECGADLDDPTGMFEMKTPKDLYIITTAKKRDSLDWEDEFPYFLLTKDPNTNPHKVSITVDSWNNIEKYTKIHDAVFLFDEQRVVGYGAWVKAFLTITKTNHWILLSATPGDTWSDYIPVFIANGFYKNKTEFLRRHAVYKTYSTYPQIDHYVDCGLLLKHKRDITVSMIYNKRTVGHPKLIRTEYDKELMKVIVKDRWNPWKDMPIVDINELCYCMRRVVNTHPSKLEEIDKRFETTKRLIIFYNFDYERELLLEHLGSKGITVAQYNGHVHDQLPETDEWVYIVQYNAGAEAWNCTATDCIIFYSPNYSYKIMAQAAGRIDRANTQYDDLYYDVYMSYAQIDVAILRALKGKRSFNEKSEKFSEV